MDKIINGINLEQFGLLYTGMIGDVVMGGSYYHENRNVPYITAEYIRKKQHTCYRNTSIKSSPNM